MPKQLIVARHPQSYWNVVKNASIKDGTRSLLLPGYSDTGLTAFGKVQAYLLGRHLRERFGRINFYFHSTLMRTLEATLIMQKRSGLVDRKRACFNGVMDFIDELNDNMAVIGAAKRIAESIRTSRQDIRAVLDSYSLFGSYLAFTMMFCRNNEGLAIEMLSSPHTVEAFIHFAANFRDYLDRIRRWCVTGTLEADEEVCLDRLLRYAIDKESKTSCSRIGFPIRIPLQDDHALAFVFDDKEPHVAVQRVQYYSPMGSLETFLKERLFNQDRLVWPRPDDTVLLLGHAKRIIRIRQILEGFDETEFNRLLKAQGTDFPQNVSLTVYENREYCWRRLGEPFALPDKIVSLGARDLGLRLGPKELSTICRKLRLPYGEVEPFLV